MAQHTQAIENKKPRRVGGPLSAGSRV